MVTLAGFPANKTSERHLYWILRAFLHPAAQPELPTALEAQAAAATVGLNLTYIQVDILVGMKKKKELLFFFGLSVPGIQDDLGDQFYTMGQEADAANIGDPGTGNWVQSFAGTSVHGVFLLVSDTFDNMHETYQRSCRIYAILLASCIAFKVQLALDQRTVTNISGSWTESFAVDAGAILLAEEGDNTTRPSWARGGSFLVFCQLEQLVPEFHKLLLDNPISVLGINIPEEGSALIGARVVGRKELPWILHHCSTTQRWLRNNNFTYHQDGQNSTDQTGYNGACLDLDGHRMPKSSADDYQSAVSSLQCSWYIHLYINWSPLNVTEDIWDHLNLRLRWYRLMLTRTVDI
ncbi:uncharacterized protein BT62DRAFT_1012980 [Guyanagaster necrorhizus]|uniref:DyP dimeric alpha+beta barrel domain-containing protein n=1 Tax=Guyanagaster necrorhizus TaxID=856835 RepID=A0A9P8ALV4_9AGAR|nr:uncharacterized protein BT62DRAFT_1012980 [Guyanagaster necrorhizus MCA 3950]KAG7440195.1 hypothetical protein BT62DRAFT_1012980 [Guyanagaster necrorhizus MCA 3950]